MTAAWRFEAIGTAWQIDTAAPLGDAERAAVTARIETFDRTWSRFREDSAVWRLRSRTTVDLGPDAPTLLGLYDRLAPATAGAVNPFVGAGLEILGYDAEYSLRPRGEATAAPHWQDHRLDGTVLSVPAPVVLDVGAAGKGYLADRVADVVAVPCVVDASGDLVNRSCGPLRVALEHPDDPELAVGVAEVPDGWALCGSATNRRTWGEGMHHVLDARNGRPVDDVVATWVLAPTAAEADALATALFFVGPEALADFTFGYVRLDRQRRVDHARFTGEVF